MPLELPGVIASYIAAENAGDLDAVARCFSAQAIVRDERQAHMVLEGDRIAALEIHP